jgi:hypothetical protein
LKAPAPLAPCLNPNLDLHHQRFKKEQLSQSQRKYSLGFLHHKLKFQKK